MSDKRKERIVFVGAHPDDTEGYGATAFLLREKYELHVVDLTRGELGLGMPGLLDGTTAARRVKEEEAACALLGATPHFLAETDGSAYASKASVDLLADLLKELRPVAVFTHWPIDAHQDHVQTTAVTIHALNLLDYAPELYYFEVIFAQTANFNPVYYVDVSTTIDKKAALMRKYECQNPGDYLPLEKTWQASIRGAEALPPVKHAEIFSTFDGQPIPGGVLHGIATPGMPLLVRKVDGEVLLPEFNESAWAFNKGYKPKGIVASECTVRGALLLNNLRVETLTGRRLARDVDYKVDPDWGVIGLLPGVPQEPVNIRYSHYLQRLDSIVEKDGAQTRLYGVPCLCCPVAPEVPAGAALKENILVTVNGEEHFPLLDAAASAPRTKAAAEQTIPRTLAKLRNGEPVKVLAWGDSVTACGYLPESDKWQEQFIRRLRKAFPKSEITLVSNGWGGRTTRDFMNEPAGSRYNYAETVLAVKPDLVISEFVNDAGIPVPESEERYAKILADFRSAGMEWIILTPHYVRCDWMNLKRQHDCDEDPRPYVHFIRRFAAENNVGLADAALRWGHLWREGIPFETLFLNNINHPDTLGLSFFADALMDFFGD